MGGDSLAVDKASQVAKELGARRIMPLNVSGPFHTSLMAGAGEALEKKFQEVSFQAPEIPVIFNATAKPLREGEKISDLLVKQVQSSVFFEDSIRYMLAQGVDTLVEIGPGKVLSGFVKKIDNSVKTFSIEDVETLEAALSVLKAV